VHGWLTLPSSCPYHLLYDRRAFATQAPREDILEALREYEQARADLLATKIDLAKFGSYRDFALVKFRLTEQPDHSRSAAAGCRGSGLPAMTRRIISTATRRSKVPWCGPSYPARRYCVLSEHHPYGDYAAELRPVPVTLPSDAFAKPVVHPKFGLYHATVVAAGH